MRLLKPLFGVIVAVVLSGCAQENDRASDAHGGSAAFDATSDLAMARDAAGSELLDAALGDAALREAGTGDAASDAGPRMDAASSDAPMPSADGGRSDDAGPAEAGSGATFDSAFAPPVAQNPWTATDEFATQHGDSAASDTSRFRGPGSASVRMQRVDLLAACPSLLLTKAFQLLAVCTQILSLAPTVYLLSPGASAPLATLELTAGSLFGGVYPYLDHEDRLVIVDGTNHLLQIAVVPSTGSNLRLEVVDSLDLSAAIPKDCGRSGCDGVVGLAPDYEGRIWFATDGGLTGFVDRNKQIRTLALSPGERVANSIASAPAGVAVVSDHALYLLRVDEQGAPTIAFRASYERGSARKPGQLSHGSGSTPTFFGPHTGGDYIAILDNARPAMNLLVFHARAGGELVCSLTLPLPTGYGGESSPIGIGRSVIVSSSYGYPYAAALDGSGPADPESAPLLGGLTRVDVQPDERSCKVVWSNVVRSAAVPKLSLADQHLYTFERTPLSADGVAGLLDSFAYTAISADTGAVTYRQELPDLPDTMQLAGTIARDGALYQGTMFGFVRVAP